MKTKELVVPTEIIMEVAKMLGENEVTNEIVGATDGEEIIIQVTYDRDERDVISEIKDLIADCYEIGDQEED
jgi:hypothetical protein